MNTPGSSSRDQLAHAFDELTAGASPTSSSPRRAFFAQMSAAALAMMFTGAIAGQATAAPRPARSRTHRRWHLGDHVLIVQQLDGDVPLIAMEIFEIKDLDNPLYNASHTGKLTDTAIERIDLLVDFAANLLPSHVDRFNALLRSFRLHELAIPTRGEPDIPTTMLILMLLWMLIWLAPG